MFGKKEEEMEAADKYETARNNCHTQNTRLQKIHSKFGEIGTNESSW